MTSIDALSREARDGDELWMTTRRSGGQTATYPMWFVLDGNRLYALSSAASTEVWDVIANPKVMVKIRNKDKDEHFEMNADIMKEEEWIPMMVKLLKKKYGDRNTERVEAIEQCSGQSHVIIKLKVLSD